MALTESSPVTEVEAVRPEREVIYRHGIVVRVTHWINVLCATLLLLSGLQIFNYHPALYWGNTGYGGVGASFVIGSVVDPATGAPAGVTRSK